MVSACRLAGGICEQILWLCTKLGSEEFDNLARDDFAGCQETSRKAERTELQSETKPVPRAAAKLDVGKVIVCQGVVSKQPVRIGRQ